MIKLSHSIIVSTICLLTLTWYFSGMMDEYHTEQMRLQDRVWELEEQNGCDHLEYSNRISYKVTVTTYNPTVHQCDDTPHITADGTHFKTWKATDYRYVALSRDLLSRWGGPFEYGDYIVIEGTGSWDGVYQVRDTMNPKWVNVVDILESKDVEPYKFTNAHIFKLPWVDTEKG